MVDCLALTWHSDFYSKFSLTVIVNDAIQLGSPAGFEFAIDTPENPAADEDDLREQA
jgi:hypothetical protein